MERLRRRLDSCPTRGDFDLTGLDIPAEDFEELMEIDHEAFRADLVEAEEYLAQFGDKVPPRLTEQLRAFRARLG